MHDLASVRLVVELCDKYGFPRGPGLGIAAGECGGSITHTPPRGDGGQAAGIIQMRADIHGGPPERWEGLDGARRSLERALSGTSPPWWMVALRTVQQKRGNWDGSVAWFADLWYEAQRANRAAVDAAAARALAAGREALALYEASEGTMGRIAKPAIIWRGAHPRNYAKGRDGYSPEVVILHRADGTMDGMDAWFNDPAAGVSAHYGVAKDGRKHGYVDPADTAFANGLIEAGATAFIIRENPGVNPNKVTISVEFEGRPGEPLTPAQFASGVELIAWLFQDVLRTGDGSTVYPDADHIDRHASISPQSRARCPGWDEATHTAIIHGVQDMLNGAGEPAPTPDTRLIDAITVQARALRETAAALTIQADNLDALLKG